MTEKEKNLNYGKNELIEQIDSVYRIDDETIVLGRNGKERFFLTLDFKGKVIEETNFIEQYELPNDKAGIYRLDLTTKYDLMIKRPFLNIH